jgi:N-acetylmuramate 1-kinase
VMVYPDVTEKNLAELKTFIRLAEWLRGAGLKAPQLYDVNEGKGYAVLEDLGQVSFGKAMREGGYRGEFYTLACDVLRQMKNSGIPAGLPPYSGSRIDENRRQIVDYYIPLVTKKSNKNNILNGFLEVIDGIKSQLPACPQGFVHADFHVENLMWRPEEGGVKRCGIIDFQDALLGPLPYDLVNLLEDARVDVAPELRIAMMDRYCDGMTPEEKQSFKQWYRFLGTQFHCRVIGLFIKLAAEQSRDQYLVHIPRLQNYILEGLNDPVLAPLKVFFEKEKIDFSPIKDMNGESIRVAFQNISS